MSVAAIGFNEQVLTVRRELSGRLTLYVGEQPVAGVLQLHASSDHKDSVVQVFLDPGKLHFDVEKLKNTN